MVTSASGRGALNPRKGTTMSNVTLSSAVRSNLLSLQDTASLLAQTQERLATGLKVNSALDNPTNFFTASGLNNRAGELASLLDGVSNATQTLQAADNGITAITKLVESAQATARQAQQTSATIDSTTAATAGTVAGGSFTAVDVSGTGSGATAGSTSFSFGGSTGAFDLVDDAITFDIVVDGGGTQNITIDQAAVAAVGNNDNTIDDADEFVSILNNAITGATASNNSGTITIASDTTGASSSVAITNYAVVDTNTSGFTDNTGIGNGSGTGSAAVAADSISFTVAADGGSAQAVTIDAAAVTAYNSANGASLDASALTAANIAALVNDQTTGVTASVATGGGIDIASDTTGASSSVAIASYTAAVSGGSTGIADGSNTGSAESTSTITNPARAEFISQFNEIVGQIDELAEDAGFNGVNLLNGDSLSVTFNEDGSSELDITGVTFDSAGLGLSSLASTAFDTNSSIDTVLTNLDSAIGTLRSQASEFGSNLSIVETREDFTKAMINTLETGAANLTLADTNEEGANLLALQTRQQLSSTSLSLASQADQNVLRLL